MLNYNSYFTKDKPLKILLALAMQSQGSVSGFNLFLGLDFRTSVLYEACRATKFSELFARRQGSDISSKPT